MGAYEVVIGTTMCATVVITACAVTACMYCMCMRIHRADLVTTSEHMNERLGNRNELRNELMPAMRARTRLPRALFPYSPAVRTLSADSLTASSASSVVVVVHPDNKIALATE